MAWRSLRKSLVQVHLWFALILALPMIIIGISGSALLLQREILAASIPSAGTAGTSQPIPAIIAAAQRAAPAGTAASRYELPARERAASTVRFHPASDDGPEVDVYVDPVSLKVLGTSEVVERGPLLAFFITIHAFLAMPPPIGLPFVGWTGVVMTLMGISGLVLWWPAKGQWRRAFVMRRGMRGLPFYFEFHRIAGIWGLLVLLAVSISGIYLTFPQKIGPFVKAHIAGEETVTQPKAGFVPGSGPIGPAQAIALADAAVANARVAALELPGADKTFVVELEPQGWSPTDPRVTVVLDAETAAISFIDDPRNYSFPDQLLNWQHLLHFGVGLGWGWTVLVFLSGLMPLLLAVTGLTVWWKKRQARKSNRLAEASAIAE
ncbi:MAG TPA: PepSY-associated TM helix domain-containing protein [Micropepsaceae bacterium]|jgi:uncharacterized iron-regulated membrane protein|nr:PepSY-associated TM helix domain-containing protein [Micropepsaceae bacterium]